MSSYRGWTCGKCGGPVAGKFDTCKACGHPEQKADTPMSPSDAIEEALKHQTPAQDCEIEYWLQQAENYAEVQIPADDLRGIIARTILASRALAALNEVAVSGKLEHAYIVTHKADGRHASIVYTLEDAAREAIAGMWAGSLEDALEQEDLLNIYEAIRDPESDEWADYDGEEISFSFEDGSLSVMSIPVKIAAPLPTTAETDTLANPETNS